MKSLIKIQWLRFSRGEISLRVYDHILSFILGPLIFTKKTVVYQNLFITGGQISSNICQNGDLVSDHL